MTGAYMKGMITTPGSWSDDEDETGTRGTAAGHPCNWNSDHANFKSTFTARIVCEPCRGGEEHAETCSRLHDDSRIVKLKVHVGVRVDRTERRMPDSLGRSFKVTRGKAERAVPHNEEMRAE